MRSVFRGYFAYSPDEFGDMWKSATFTFDANCLLDLYRYQQSSARLFLEALEFVKDRVWLPHQAAKEFFRNYDEVIQGQFAAYEKLAEHVKSLPDELTKTLPRHPMLPLDQFKQWLAEVKEKIHASIGETRSTHTNPGYDDPTLKRLDALFHERMGKKPADDEYTKLTKECEGRFAKGLYPGLTDMKKTGDDKYGDAIIWLELIKLSEETKRPVIFVTSEKKPDWWNLTTSKQVIGPKKELIQELFERSGQMFYAYNTDQFVKHMSTTLGFKASEDKARKSLSDDVRAMSAMRRVRPAGVRAPRRNEVASEVTPSINFQLDEMSSHIDTIRDLLSKAKALKESHDAITAQSQHRVWLSDHVNRELTSYYRDAAYALQQIDMIYDLITTTNTMTAANKLLAFLNLRRDGAHSNVDTIRLMCLELGFDPARGTVTF